MTHKSKLICSLFESIGVFGVLLAALSAANVALAGYLLWKR